MKIVCRVEEDFKMCDEMIWEFKNVLIRLCLVAIYGCRDAKPAIKWEFIPGTYIRFYSHAFIGNMKEQLKNRNAS